MVLITNAISEAPMFPVAAERRLLQGFHMPPRTAYVPPNDTDQVTAQTAFEGLRSAEVLTAPPVLYVAGDRALLHAPRRVAVVGSRGASEHGVRRAARLARLLAESGVVVISGLAKGIDRAAHEAAIEAGGKTIAVIGTPLEKAYPAEHAELQERIYREHLLVSQFPKGQRVFPSNFVARNRTMALIAHASVIVEAGETSGTLTQAREVMKLGRPLFIMRSVLDQGLKWPSGFINDGAHVLEDVKQVLEVLR